MVNSGLTGGDTVKLHAYISADHGLIRFTILDTVSNVVATNEVNADIALAGVTSTIPCDEMIEAMFKIGQSMPSALRETALGGCRYANEKKIEAGGF